jgi:hypothetical protein
VTLREKGAADQKWLSRKGEGIYDPEVLGSGDKKSPCWFRRKSLNSRRLLLGGIGKSALGGSGIVTAVTLR